MKCELCIFALSARAESHNSGNHGGYALGREVIENR